jgi:hypothetical protein
MGTGAGVDEGEEEGSDGGRRCLRIVLRYIFLLFVWGSEGGGIVG